MMDVQLRDALNNAGLPQLAYKEKLTEEDYILIAQTISEFDTYYKSGWQGSETREVLFNLVTSVKRI